MKIGIDASNIRRGGGVTHLRELLRVAEPHHFDISRIIVWGSRNTLNLIENKTWLEKINPPELDLNLYHRIFWQRFKLSKAAYENDCNLLFVPGGSYVGSFYPVVTMSQNLLPFEWHEIQRYGFSLITLKLLMLRFLQSYTFTHANGVIFLSKYAQRTIIKCIKSANLNSKIIPHGIDKSFNNLPKKQLPITMYSFNNPYQILYVSHVEQYKHQCQVVNALSYLRDLGFPVVLKLIGPEGNAITKLKRTINKIDPKGQFVSYLGNIPHEEIHMKYIESDLFVYASSCENLPIILLEGMASGLPVACSNRGPMPEVLGDAGIYFNPENSKDISQAIIELLKNPQKRSILANRSYEKSKNYSWKLCANETLNFLSNIARK